MQHKYKQKILCSPNLQCQKIARDEFRDLINVEYAGVLLMQEKDYTSLVNRAKTVHMSNSTVL